MSYKVDRWPKLLFGSVGAFIVLFLTSLFLRDFIPILHGEYQRYKLRQCQGHDKFDKPSEDQNVFAFDARFDRLTADSAANRDAIQCILDSQDVAVHKATQDINVSAGQQLLVIGHYDFSPTLTFDYYPNGTKQYDGD